MIAVIVGISVNAGRSKSNSRANDDFGAYEPPDDFTVDTQTSSQTSSTIPGTTTAESTKQNKQSESTAPVRDPTQETTHESSQQLLISTPSPAVGAKS